MSTATITELEVLFTANTKPVDDAAKKVTDQAKKIEKKPVELEIDGDAKPALDAMDRVEEEAKKIVSAKTMATVDANIERAETSLGKVQEKLDYLHSVENTMEVTADIKRAETALKQITRRRDGLVAAKESMVIDANTAPAEAALDELADDAGEAGAEGGEEAGAGLAGGIEKALQALPVAGGIVLAGVAIGKAVLDGIQDGLSVEVGQDRLQALTGLDEAQARTVALAAGEAYANVFGESIEANMDTARLALQFDLIDDDATTRQAQNVVESLAGIADVLGEDVQPVAATVTTMLSSGLVSSAEEAFDLIAAGAREGVNRNEDLLDTLTEYPALFQRLGLSGPEALGLISQGLDGGARNADLAADALKEFQIRATDASEASAEGFEALGFNAEEMTAKIAAGGEGAREGLGQVLTALSEMEDPVARNAAAVALFGTQAEDLGEALFNMDLSTAVDELGTVTGAAQTMFDTLTSNDASKMEEAQRNIQVATDGIKGALASAFSEPLGDLAEWVSMNRGPIMEFILGLANGALEFGRGTVNAVAAGTEAFGAFVGGPLADTVEGIGNLIAAVEPFAALIGIDLPGTDLQNLADDMRTFGDEAETAADDIRDTLLPGIDDAQDRLNEFGIPAIAAANFHDASMRLAGAIGEVGVASDGTQESIEDLDAANLTTTANGRRLESQIRAAVDALNAESAAGAAAGETQATLTERYEDGRQALIDQLKQMGFAEEDAIALADAYGAVPGNVDTIFEANTTQAQNNISRFLRNNDGKRIKIRVDTVAGQQVITSGQGRFTQIGMAAGGVLGSGLTPMSPIAQAVDPNTWRVIGDRMKDREFYIPDDGSSRSLSVLLEAMRSFGVLPMAGGGVVGTHAGTPRAMGALDLSDRSITALAEAILAGASRVARGVVNAEAGSYAYAGGRV